MLQNLPALLRYCREITSKLTSLASLLYNNAPKLTSLTPLLYNNAPLVTSFMFTFGIVAPLFICFISSLESIAVYLDYNEALLPNIVAICLILAFAFVSIR
jgi:hypothetical protein